MSEEIVSTTYESPSFGRTLGAVTAGGVTALTVNTIGSIFTNKANKAFLKFGEQFNNIDNSCIFNSSNNVLSEKGLNSKGVNILNVHNYKGFDESKFIAENFMNIKKQNTGIKFFDLMREGGYQEMRHKAKLACKGKQALHIRENNLIVINKKLSSALPHEIGHSLNKHKLGVGFLIDKIRNPLPMRIASGVLLSATILSAIFKNKKAEGEKTNGVLDTTTTFLKDNAVAITALSQIPILAEEGLASIRGQQAFKKYLPKELFSKLKILNGKAWLTYLLSSIVTTGTMYAFTKVRDAIAHNKTAQGV